MPAFVDRVVILHEALDVLGIPHGFGGALALAYHAEPRGTTEIDLNVFLGVPEAGRVIDSLAEIGIAPPPAGGESLAARAPALGIRCPWDDVHVDLFFSYDDVFFAEVQRRTERHLFLDSREGLHELPFLSAADLAIFKISFNRSKDWADIEAMLRQRPIDQAYVERWLLYLRGDAVWTKLRRFLDLCNRIAPGSPDVEAPADEPGSS